MLIYWCCLFVLSGVVGKKLQCDSIFGCISSVTQDDCKVGEYLVPNGAINGCCPGCKGGKEIDESCKSNADCAPGLKCEQKECTYDRTTCFYTLHLDEMVGWIPKCNKDGTFGAKQCRGDRLSGRCFCYSEDGKRIFGWDWFKNAEDMTCGCSRRRAKLEASGRLDVTLHCEQNGNYEELQCDSGICWCAEPLTGQPQMGTIVIHDELWHLLPCYNKTLYGDQYLRVCESAAFAQKTIEKRLSNRGTTEISYNNIQCDYDGTYGKYIVQNGMVSCTWRDGKKIGSFQARSNTISQINCNCARDQMIYEEAGMELSLECGGNGNYEDMQDLNGRLFCVDRDGYVVANKVYPDELCGKFIFDSDFYE